MVEKPVESNYQVRALTRGLAVLANFTPETPRHSLSDLSKLVDVPKSTLFRLLESLCALEFLEQEADGSFTMGIKAFEVGSAYLSKLEFPLIARKELEDLAVTCRETASLGVMSHGEVVYVAIERAQREIGIQSQVGTRHPTHCTALGKVMLADLPDTTVVAILEQAGMPARTEHTHTSAATMLSELEVVRQRGYAIDNEERAYGVKCIAGPIRDASGRVIAAISVSGPAFRMSADALPGVIAAVVAAATATSRRLGYREARQPLAAR
jgi:IclR family KDG regulon transcriptional repressor